VRHPKSFANWIGNAKYPFDVFYSIRFQWWANPKREYRSSKQIQMTKTENRSPTELLF
jgi:hypothetical protein